jgi:nitroimidazol reductase NimA-like FMN-containing flavoprotein (pyridoxamine 5'-phosphate oxidase superfamily)
VSIKFRRMAPEVLNCFMNYYSVVLRGLIITVSKANIEKELATIAEAFKNSIAWAEQGGFEEKLRQEF